MTERTFPINSAHTLASLAELLPEPLQAAGDEGNRLYPATALAYALSDMFPDLVDQKELTVLVIGSEREARWAAAATHHLLGRADPIRVLREDVPSDAISPEEDKALPAVAVAHRDDSRTQVDLVFVMNPSVPDPEAFLDEGIPHSWMQDLLNKGIKIAGAMPTMFEADLLSYAIDYLGGGRAMQLVVPAYLRKVTPGAPVQEMGRHLFGFAEPGNGHREVEAARLLGLLHKAMTLSAEKFGGVQPASGKIVRAAGYEGDIVVGLEGYGFGIERSESIQLQFDDAGEIVQRVVGDPITVELPLIDGEKIPGFTASQRVGVVCIAQTLSGNAGLGENWLRITLDDMRSDPTSFEEGADFDAMPRLREHPLSFEIPDQSYPFRKPIQLEGVGTVYGQLELQGHPSRESHEAVVNWMFADGSYVGAMALEVLRPDAVLTDDPDDVGDLAPWAAALLGRDQEFDKRVLTKWGLQERPAAIVRLWGAGIAADLDGPGRLSRLILEGLRGIAAVLAHYGDTVIGVTAQCGDPFVEAPVNATVRMAALTDLKAIGFVPALPITQERVDAITDLPDARAQAAGYPQVLVLPAAETASTPNTKDELGLSTGRLEMSESEIVDLPGVGAHVVTVGMAKRRAEDSYDCADYLAAVQWSDTDLDVACRCSFALTPTGGDVVSAGRLSVAAQDELSTLVERSGHDLVVTRRAIAAWGGPPDVVAVLLDVETGTGFSGKAFEAMLISSMRAVRNHVKALSGREVSFVLYPMTGAAIDGDEPAPEVAQVMREMGLIEAGTVKPDLFELVPASVAPPERPSSAYLVPAELLDRRAPGPADKGRLH